MDRKKRILSLLVTLAVTLACVPALPTVAPLATRPAGYVETIIAGTAAAAAKSTERASSPTPRPNDTLVPTFTPGPAVSPTATIIFKIPTVEISSGGGTGGSGSSGSGGGSSGPPPPMSCKISEITPRPGAHIKPDIDFTTTWRVSNRGSALWDVNSVDYRYMLGAKLHKQPIYDLPFSVPPGNTVYLSVAMHSPSAPGVYTTTWAMNQGSTVFCKLETKIIVP